MFIAIGSPFKALYVQLADANPWFIRYAMITHFLAMEYSKFVDVYIYIICIHLTEMNRSPPLHNIDGAFFWEQRYRLHTS